LLSLSRSFFFLSPVFAVLDFLYIFHLFLLWGSLLMVWLGRKTVEKRRRERKRETQQKRRTKWKSNSKKRIE
jgi:membrane protein implicated in regulation of membrane protease activity